MLTETYNSFVRLFLVVIAMAFSLSSVSAYALIDLTPKTSINIDANRAELGGDNRSEVGEEHRAVEIRYNQPGRLLALVPVTMKVKVTVNADGNVEVKYPWYSLFTLDNEDQIEVKVKVAVDNALKGHMVGSVRADGEPVSPTLTTSELATLVESIQAVLKASFN